MPPQKGNFHVAFFEVPLNEVETIKNNRRSTINLTPDDLVFVTNGSITESTTYGDNDTPASPRHELGGSWQLWQTISL